MDKAIHRIHRYPLDSVNNWGQWNSFWNIVFYKRISTSNMHKRSKVLLSDVLCDLIAWYISYAYAHAQNQKTKMFITFLLRKQLGPVELILEYCFL